MWFSPTGHNDSGGSWGDEELAYNKDTSDWARESWGAGNNWLELLLDPPISCPKIRIYAAKYKSSPEEWLDPNLRIEVYYDGGWNLIKQGFIANLAYVEFDLGGTKQVEKARVKSIMTGSYTEFQIYEFDFWVVSEAPGYGNCIAQWRMNDNADNSDVINNIDNNFKGTYHGTGGADDYTSAHSVAGKIKTALEFDGTNDEIRVPHGAVLNLTQEFTIVAWIYPATILSNDRVIVNKGLWKYFFGSGGNNRIKAQVNNSEYLMVSEAVPLNEWTLVVWVHSNSGDFDKIYYDGQLKIKGDLPDPTGATNDLMISGYYGGGSIYRFNGHIDNTIIFNKALSVEEIAWLWNNGNGRENLGAARPLVGGSLASDRKGLV